MLLIILKYNTMHNYIIDNTIKVLYSDIGTLYIQFYNY